MPDPLVEVRKLKKYFETPKGMLHAVDDVTLTIEKGSTIGIVGESGCGKSTLGRTIIHLYKNDGGQIIFKGEDITNYSGKKLKRLHNQMQMIHQDPYSSLNPRMTVQDIIKEPIALTKHSTKKEIDEKTEQLMSLVGIDRRMRRCYPHEMDGGRRQRVGIARALAMDPEFIVCDEPVSALDVSVQAQILNLLQDIQEQKDISYMFVTHDMSVLRYIASSICVMYLGQVVENCTTKELFETPLHPYSQALLSSIPSIDIDHPRVGIAISGELNSPIDPKPGCRFAPRCRFTCKECYEPQKLTEINKGHFVACCRAKEI